LTSVLCTLAPCCYYCCCVCPVQMYRAGWTESSRASINKSEDPENCASDCHVSQQVGSETGYCIGAIQPAVLRLRTRNLLLRVCNVITKTSS
jgi:hypothetical protein